MHLPLDVYRFGMPNEQGQFGAVRKHDIHTGIDLYCPPNSKVFAMEAGRVIVRGAFTGMAAGSPWWNDTQYLVIRSDAGRIILYGEIRIRDQPFNSLWVSEGECIGNVRTVLKSNKSLPMTMLHLEQYSSWPGNPEEWPLNKEKPDNLLDPTMLLAQALYEEHQSPSCVDHDEVVEIASRDVFIEELGSIHVLTVPNFDRSLLHMSKLDKVSVDGMQYQVTGINRGQRGILQIYARKETP